MYYHITSLTNDIIASNLPPELWSEANRCVNVSVSELCPVKNKKKRHGVIISNDIRLYLCTYDENITNKIFKRYQESAVFFGAELIQHKKKHHKGMPRSSFNFKTQYIYPKCRYCPRI